MRFCSKCGAPIENGQQYCSKCGSFINNSNLYHNQLKGSRGIKQKFIFIGVGIGIGFFLLVFLFVFLFQTSREKYYFGSDSYEQEEEVPSSLQNASKRGKYSTAIIYDHTYSGVEIEDDTDAIELIVKDSVDQKDQCPAEIKSIEDEIISKYGITAVNLCEMDIEFARELENVFEKIYTDYPQVRGYITNLTLVNASLSDGYIAAFMPVFNFATAKTSSTYPWVIKTQVLLNTSYFLNPERLEASVVDGANSGHFPPNATIYSPVAHELGHYLSFLAMMKNYQLNSILLVDNNNVNTFYELYSDFGEGNYSLSMIKEAYSKYQKDTNTDLTLDEWRGTISQYALAKDNSGEYIYDETVAEAFHDVYLNGDYAKDASKYIVDVLKEKLNG